MRVMTWRALCVRPCPQLGQPLALQAPDAVLVPLQICLLLRPGSDR